MQLRTGKNGRYRQDTCATQARQGKTACPGLSIAMDDLDRIVVDHLTDRIIVPERLTELLG
jgi:site-specific DNA recombinase